mmetsp:Transcript_13790/g.41632  ORF Transcript_13790/g.41632 Transcript_13790/m.41632 type:complete len:434 (+) Transcript_13790:648-1949(+)
MLASVPKMGTVGAAGLARFMGSPTMASHTCVRHHHYNRSHHAANMPLNSANRRAASATHAVGQQGLTTLIAVQRLTLPRWGRDLLWTRRPQRQSYGASAVACASGGRSVSTTPTIKRLESVQNMRDLAEAYPGIQPGRVFRSACPNVASPADVRLLREDLGIAQLIDLRSKIERREDVGAELLMGAEIIQTARLRGFEKWDRFSKRRNEQIEVEMQPDLPGQLVVHHVGLIEKTRYLRSLLTRLPRRTILSGALSAVFSQSRAKSIVLSEVNRGGLPLLYEILLESAGTQLHTVLKIITRAAERGQPSLFYCKLGKDRTGITAVLVLSACGASEEEILADYTRSDAVKGIALGGLENTKELEGLDVNAFSAAPREAMATALQYVRETYGTLHGYMDFIGFTAEDRARLKAALGGETRPGPPVDPALAEAAPAA